MGIINELIIEVNTFVNLYRSTNKYAYLLVGDWFHQIACRGLQFQRLLLLKILKHQIWKDVLPNFFNLENAYNTLNNLSKGWQYFKGNHSKDDQCAWNVSIPMVASNSIHNICHICHNLSLGLATKARACKVVGQEGSPGVMLHAPRSARECEGIDPHTPKGIPSLGVRVLVDSQMFKERLQESKPNGLRISLSLEIYWNIDV
jgi:hypothetical protein